MLAVFLLFMWHPATWAHIGFTVLVTLLVSVGLVEFFAMVARRDIEAEKVAAVVMGALVVISGHFGDPMMVNRVLVAGAVVVAGFHIVRGRHTLPGIGASIFGMVYVGWFGAHVTLLRSWPDQGPALIFMLFTAVILTDTFAYAVGSMIGRTKLAPAVSPNKTWEGSLGGLAFAVGGMCILYALQQREALPGLPAWPLWRYAVVAVALAVTAQIGDLIESCLKRDAGVKDSGTILPGHGGVLDRCDGFLFAAPVLYYVVLPLCNS
jgi:phosphatidate cytidylyltransferase